jgi:hypothetical protein
LPSSRQRRTAQATTSRIRALPCAPSVWKPACQPRKERAGTPADWSAIASSPAVTCSPLATTWSYSAVS